MIVQGTLESGMRFLIVWDCLSTSATLPNVNITPLNFATSENVATNPSAGRDLRRKKACERGRREESEEKDKQWAIPRETLHSSLSCFLFYTMLKSPILRPRLIAKLENRAWRGPVMNSGPNHATELVWWRPCHCRHRAQSSWCGQLPPLTWEENTAVSQVSLCTACGPHGNCFFMALAYPLKCGECTWWVQPLSSVLVLTEKEMGKAYKHLQPLEREAGSASSKIGKGFRSWAPARKTHEQSSWSSEFCRREIPWSFTAESGHSEKWWTRKVFILEVRFHQNLKDKEIGMAVCRDGRGNSLVMECHEQESGARKTRAGWESRFTGAEFHGEWYERLEGIGMAWRSLGCLFSGVLR